MSQFDFGVIDPTTKSGTALAADLNAWRTALHSTHGGVARPAYATAGMLWVEQVSAVLWYLKMFTGAIDVIIGEVNPATGEVKYYTGIGGASPVASVAQVLNARGENRIINGKFAIDQRNVGASVTLLVNGTYTLDRWAGAVVGAGQYQISREADALYPGEFRMKIAVTVADAAIAAGDLYFVYQPIEGVNISDLNFGTAGAQQLTLAFEVESNVAGTFPVALYNGSVSNRSYVGTYTVNAANVRETKVITLTADTAGAWPTGTASALAVAFGLAQGTTYQAPAANVWSAGAFSSVAGMTNFMATFGNTMRLKNVRLYRGSMDLGPDQRLYADEMRLCQRYFWKTFPPETKPATAAGTNTAPLAYRVQVANINHAHQVLFPVNMRVPPTITFYSPGGATADWWNNSGGVISGAASNSITPRENSMIINNTQLASDLVSNLLSIHATASAEL